ncbi:hypothetical protein H6G00_15605 [Leptolyngbya sp. FACHB-541]|uniref:hypothetical protein n=1 Tax=Leptolyngbya sp. FACHB-541 TaxID=2692810 RepID=UPI001682DA3F|nr:hypothetical protein [Leptolyngbya sp. FACHB-541]MBD1998038.1 hypothetical protein [Leptolyngbya sp. FACHB-541]
MARGFGVVQPKQRSSRKSASQKLQKKQTDSQQRSVEIREEIENFLEQDRHKNPDQHTLAWLAGVYNPLGEGAEDNARFLEADEEEWLFLAKEVGWLQVEDELDAIYFTAPPPNFDPAQADWYIRPDLTSWLEEPELLGEAIAKYPISAELMRAAIARYTKPLGWNAEKIEAFIRETTGRPSTEMAIADCTIVLLELGRL